MAPLNKIAPVVNGIDSLISLIIPANHVINLVKTVPEFLNIIALFAFIPIIMKHQIKPVQNAIPLVLTVMGLIAIIALLAIITDST
jgi:hypothetical protein